MPRTARSVSLVSATTILLVFLGAEHAADVADREPAARLGMAAAAVHEDADHKNTATAQLLEINTAGPATVASGVAAAPPSAAPEPVASPPPEAMAPPPEAMAPPAAPDPATATATAPAADGGPIGEQADPCGAMLATAGLAPPMGWVLECHAGRSGLMGETSPTRRAVVIYLRSSWSVREAARVYGHEVGHAYDFAVLTDADRARWTEQRGLPSGWGSWCPAGTTCGDEDRPAGDWAEAVGELLVPGTGMWDGNLAGPPSPADLDVLRSILSAHGAPV